MTTFKEFLAELHGHRHLKHVPIRPREPHLITQVTKPKAFKGTIKPIKPPKERKKPQRIHF